MLDLEPRSEAHALLQYMADGDDPEPTSALWAEATLAEMRQVVNIALAINPAERGSEWVEDFLYSHSWLRAHGHRTVADAQAATNAPLAN